MLLLNPTHIKLCWPSCLIKQSRQWTRHLQFMNQMFYSATMIYSRTFTDDYQRCLTFCLPHTHTHTRTVWITSCTHVQDVEWNYSLQGQQCDGLHKWPDVFSTHAHLLCIEVLHVLSAQGNTRLCISSKQQFMIVALDCTVGHYAFVFLNECWS